MLKSEYKKCSRVENSSDESIETTLGPGLSKKDTTQIKSSSVPPTTKQRDEDTRTVKKDDLEPGNKLINKPGDKLKKDDLKTGDKLPKDDLEPEDVLRKEYLEPREKLKRKELSPLSELPSLGSLSSQLGIGSGKSVVQSFFQ